MINKPLWLSPKSDQLVVPSLLLPCGCHSHFMHMAALLVALCSYHVGDVMRLPYLGWLLQGAYCSHFCGANFWPFWSHFWPQIGPVGYFAYSSIGKFKGRGEVITVNIHINGQCMITCTVHLFVPLSVYWWISSEVENFSHISVTIF